MSKEQINTLGKTYSYFYRHCDFVSVWFGQNYSSKLSKINENKEKSEDEKRKDREEMLQIIDELHKLSDMSLIKE